MKSLFDRQAERFVRERKRYKRWLALFLCLALVVSSGTYMSLTREGRAEDTDIEQDVEQYGLTMENNAEMQTTNSSSTENITLTTSQSNSVLGTPEAGGDNGNGGTLEAGGDNGNSGEAGTNGDNGNSDPGAAGDNENGGAPGADGDNEDSDSSQIVEDKNGNDEKADPDKTDKDGEADSDGTDDENLAADGEEQEKEEEILKRQRIKKQAAEAEYIQIDKSIQELIDEYTADKVFTIAYKKVENTKEGQTDEITDDAQQDGAGTGGQTDDAQQDGAGTGDQTDDAQQDGTGTEGTADDAQQDGTGTEGTADDAQQDGAGTEGTANDAQQDGAGTEGTADGAQQEGTQTEETADAVQPENAAAAVETAPGSDTKEAKQYVDDEKMAEIKENQSLVITLLTDVEEQGALSVPEGSTSVTLNLGEYTLSVVDPEEKNAISVHDGKFLLTGSKGKLERADSQSAMRAISVDGDGVLSVENVEISGFNSIDPEKEYDKSNNENMIADGGGAILVTNGSSLTIKNAKLHDNTAAIGGAVCMSESGSTMNLENVEMTGNQSLGDGGAVYMTGKDSSNRSYFNMRGGSISGNSIDETNYSGCGGAVCLKQYVTANIQGTSGAAEEEDKSGYVRMNENSNACKGGGLYMGTAALLTAQYAEFSWNIIGNDRDSTAIGGICIERNYSSLPGPAVTLDHVDIIGNKTGGYYGGCGLYYRGYAPIKMTFCNVCDNMRERLGGGGLLTHSGKLIMDSCVVSNNKANNDGGAGIDIRGGADISNSLISNNTAAGANSYGGGIAVRGSSEVKIGKKTQIINNTARGYGGGIYSDSNSYNLVLEDVTIENNSSGPRGGGVYGKIKTATDVLIKGNSTTVYEYANGGGGLDGWITTANGVVIEENTSLGFGGGIHGGIANIGEKGLIIRNNRCDYSGGAIFLMGGLTITDGTEFSGNTGSAGGAVHICGGVHLKMTGGVISDNTATSGGAVSADGSFTMSGGRIENNTAEKGGAVCGSTDANQRNITLSGGIIKGNNAVEGGGVYAGRGISSNLIINGTIVTENSAAYGGGVYAEGNSSVNVAAPGSLYWNSAGEGADLYAKMSTVETRTISLLAPGEMKPEEGVDLGSSPAWYFETKRTSTTESVRYDTKNQLMEDMLLTLQTSVNVSGIVAKIGSTEYKTVQDAVDAIQRREKENGSRIIMVGESPRETVTVPAGVTAVLNLNGYTLSGKTRAIECKGDLTIVDEEEKDGTAGTDNSSTILGYPHAGAGKVGTIIGRTSENGGGILVTNNGKVVMQGGRIYASKASGNGGGVYVKAGVFELAGGTIEKCSAKNGAAVGTESNFKMTAGSISGNSTTHGKRGADDGHGAVYVVQPGIAQISGGEITGNSAMSGAAIYLQGSSLNMTGSGESIVSVTKNSASEDGGAIYVNGENASATIGYAQISENTVSGAKNGGAAYINSGTLTLKEGTVIEKNQAVNGGGVYQNSGNLYMIGGKIRKNTAREHGGGIAQASRTNMKFVLSKGLLAENKANSKTLPAGNDLYCYYGAGTSSSAPLDSLMRACEMEQPESGDRYNAWEDESWKGAVDSWGPKIGDYKYITGIINESKNLALTAVHVDADIEAAVTNKVITEATLTWKDGMVNENDSVKKEEKFDAEGVPTDWKAGYDGSSENNLVRSYDKITYEVNLKCEPEKEADKDETGNTGTGTREDGDRTIKMWLSVDVPCLSTEIGFDGSGMKLSYVESRVEDGKEYQTLYGYWEQKDIAGSANTIKASVGIEVYGMTNGEKITPTFHAWVEGNGPEKKRELQAKTIVVSSAPMYNVVLETNDKLEYTGYFNLNTGEEISEQEYKELKKEGGKVVYGMMTGYGAALQMKGSDGIKGSEVPKGDMTFDLDFASEMFIDGIEIKNGSIPYLWAYKENNRSVYGNSASGRRFQMDWDDQDDKDKTTSYIQKNNVPLYDSLYNGGSWSMTDQYRIVRKDDDGESPEHAKDWQGLHLGFKVSDYELESGAMSGDTRTISTGYVQVIYPMNEYVLSGTDIGSGQHFLSLKAEGAVSNFKATGKSGREPLCIIDVTDQSDPAQVKTLNEDLADMKRFFGVDEYEKYTIHETTFIDNYKSKELGKGIFLGEGGDGLFSNDIIYKSNDFRTKGFGGISDSLRGLAATPLSTQVYITGKVEYNTGLYNTENELSPYYNENYNYLTDEVYERNYMTSMNLLQKFDGEIFKPVETGEITNKKVVSNGNGTYIGGNENFILQSNEEATSWSDTKSREFTVSVLYAAKPDGTGWVKETLKLDQNGNRVADGSADYFETTDGGAADMEKYHEEDLIYFRTLKDLEDYFKTSEGGKGICVGVLYEIRDCCVRTGHYVNMGCLVETKKEFKNTGITYCTTNDARVFTTYRPLYKDYYLYRAKRDKNNKPIMTDSPLINHFSWLDMQYGMQNNIRSYGNGNKQSSVEGYDGVLESGTEYHDKKESGRAYTTDAVHYPVVHKAVQDKDAGYRKTEYWHGFKIASTHTSPYKGNSILLYTLDGSISISNTDKRENSNRLRETYDLSKAAQRTVNYEVVPKLNISSAVSNYELVASGSQDVDVIITFDIPKYLSFNGGFKFTYEGYSTATADDMSWDWTEVKKEETDAKGNRVVTGSTIELRTTIADIALGLPKIEYSCAIVDAGDNDPVTGGQVLKTDVTIRTEYDGSRYNEQNRLADVSYTSSCSISTVSSSNDAIWMRAEEEDFWKVKDIGSDLVYSMYYRNTTTEKEKNISLLNILPYNGDDAGTGNYDGWRKDSNGKTTFHGGYQVKTVEIIFADEESRKAYVDGNSDGTTGKLKAIVGFETEGYSETSAALNSMVQSKGEELSGFTTDGLTVTYDLTGENLIQKATEEDGIALYWLLPEVSSDNKVQIRITMSPKAGDEYIEDDGGKVQQSRDAYYNDFCYWSGGGSNTGAPGRCTTVWERIVGRSLSGRVWLDMDQNGHYKGETQYTKDTPIGGVKVSLYTLNQENAVSGKEPRTVDTSAGTKTYYPAKDVYGRDANVVTTDAEGKYVFDEIAPGNYVVFFENMEGGGDISGMPFGKLSVTPVRNLASQSTDNNAVPYYNEPQGDNLAELAYGFIGYNEAGDGIAIPALSEMPSRYSYDSVNWNCALYYVTQQVQKEWRQTDNSDIKDGTAITFTQTVVGAETGEPLAENETYTLRKTGDKSVTVYKNEAETPSSEQVKVTVNGSQNTKQADKSVIWALGELKLQAETAVVTEGKVTPGKSQKINRDFKEITEKDPSGELLKGYIVTQETSLNAATGKTVTAIVNTQVLHDITLTKRSMTGGGETDIKLPGAKYAVFSDFDCKEDKVESGDSSATAGIDYGVLTIEQLRAGTYYLKETKAPSGYALNVEKYKIEIAYPENAWKFTGEEVTGEAAAVESGNNNYNIPFIKIWRYDAEDTEEFSNGTDNGTLVYEGYVETTGANLGLEDASWAIKRDGTDNKPIVKNIVKTAEDGTKSYYTGGTHYEVKFAVRDACIYKLPSTGGIGIFPFAAGGTLLLMAAVWLMMRKRREEVLQGIHR